jgi:hypothetical protein
LKRRPNQRGLAELFSPLWSVHNSEGFGGGPDVRDLPRIQDGHSLDAVSKELGGAGGAAEYQEEDVSMPGLVF